MTALSGHPINHSGSPVSPEQVKTRLRTMEGMYRDAIVDVALTLTTRPVYAPSRITSPVSLYHAARGRAPRHRHRA